MKSLIVGGGPGGLYLAILLKKASPAAQVDVIERNASDATFGFGVVFSDETLGYLQENDEPTFQEITSTFNRWDAIEIRSRDTVRLARARLFWHRPQPPVGYPPASLPHTWGGAPLSGGDRAPLRAGPCPAV